MPLIGLLVKFSPLLIKLGFGAINFFEKDEAKRASAKLEFLKLLQERIDTAQKLVAMTDSVDEQIKSFFEEKNPPQDPKNPSNRT